MTLRKFQIDHMVGRINQICHQARNDFRTALRETFPFQHQLYTELRALEKGQSFSDYVASHKDKSSLFERMETYYEITGHERPSLQEVVKGLLNGTLKFGPLPKSPMLVEDLYLYIVYPDDAKVMAKMDKLLNKCVKADLIEQSFKETLDTLRESAIDKCMLGSDERSFSEATEMLCSELMDLNRSMRALLES